jgi:hypothetical protein
MWGERERVRECGLGGVEAWMDGWKKLGQYKQQKKARENEHEQKETRKYERNG